jgi:hypothetical protein
MNCQHCQTLLLDHLYGLLDGGEGGAVDAHLAACPACAAAHAETGRVQGLIARAAKTGFPTTRFEPPAPASVPHPAKSVPHTPAPASPAVRPLSVPKAKGPADPVRGSAASRRVPALVAALPWAVAVAVLLAVPGTVVPVLDLFDRAAAAGRAAELAKREAEAAAGTARAAVQEREGGLAAALDRYTAARQAEKALLDQWTTAERAATDRKLTLEVRRPAAVMPGAPNDFVVVVRDRRDNWEATRGRLVAEVVDASDAVVFSQPLDHQRRGDTHALRLPASAWTKLKPETELFLVVAQVDEKTGARELYEKIKLAGPVFSTLLTTDRATYRPGDRLFFRSLTLDRTTFQPPDREQVLRYELLTADRRPVSGLAATGTTDLVRVGAGRVEPVRGADGQPVRGVGCGEFVLPADLPGGDYTLVLRELPHPGGLPATVPVPVARAVTVRAGAADNYRKEIGFGRASYRPGETVEAWAELRFQEKPLPGAAVVAVAVQADGVPVAGVEAADGTDAAGRARVRFPLPDAVRDGDVRLKVTFRTPDGDEAVAARVPVIGTRTVVEFFPESGTAVAGVPCKMYVRATTPAGQPVDVRGVVTDGRRVIERVAALSDDTEPGANRGLAWFVYTPELGVPVWLKLDAPAGTSGPILAGVPVANAAVAALGGAVASAAHTGFVLPQPAKDGVVMSVLDPITGPGEPFHVRLHSVSRSRKLVVGAYTRGKLSDTQRATVEPDKPQIVKLMGGADPRGGVVRVTCFEEFEDEPARDLKPLAERLVFRKPGEVLNLKTAVAAAPGSPGPFAAGTAVNLSVAATDEKGRPAAAVLWAAAVNSGAAPGAKDRLMPTHFLLAGEVQTPDDLEYADFLLTSHPKAGAALDCVLGTQGWRRFAEQVPAQVPAGVPHPPATTARPASTEVVRLLCQNGQYATQVDTASALAQKYAPLYETVVRAAEAAEAAVAAARADPHAADAVARAARAAETAERDARVRAETAEVAREPVRRFRANVWFGVAGLVALAVGCGFVAASRRGGRYPLSFSTVGALGLAGFLAVAAGWGDRALAAAAPAGHAPDARREVASQRGNAELARAPAPVPPAAPGGLQDTLAMPNDGHRLARPTDKRQPGAGESGPMVGMGAAAEPPRVPPAPVPGRPAGGMSQLPVPAVPKLSNPAPGAYGGAPGGYKPLVPNTVPAGLDPPPFSGPTAAPPAPSAAPEFGPGPSATLRPAPAADGMSPATGGADNGARGPAAMTHVTAADLDRSKGALVVPPAARYSARRVEDQAELLKQASDKADEFAKDRANNIAGRLRAAFADRPAQAKAAPPPAKENQTQEFDGVAEQRVLGAMAAAVPPLVVREFAAPRPAAAPLPDAADAPDTVLWQPVVVLPADGKATFTFALGAAPGGYRVVVAGHTADGRLGAARDFIPVARAAAADAVAPGAPPVPAAPVAPGPQPMR